MSGKSMTQCSNLPIAGLAGEQITRVLWLRGVAWTDLGKHHVGN